MRRQRDKGGGELAHQSIYPDGCIGVLSASGACLAWTEAERRQPATDMKRSGMEVGMSEQVS